MSEEPVTTTFEEVCRPLMEWLTTNKHPHTKVIVESDSAEMVEGVVCFKTDDYLRD